MKRKTNKCIWRKRRKVGNIMSLLGATHNVCSMASVALVGSTVVGVSTVGSIVFGAAEVGVTSGRRVVCCMVQH